MTPNPHPIIKTRPAIFPADKEAVSKLFLAYEQFLLDYADVSLDFQNFTLEVAELPGKYAVENSGALYLAYIDIPLSNNQTATDQATTDQATNDQPTTDAATTEQIIGCLGVRVFTASQSCELKRLYLTPESRGLGAAKLLLEVSIARARELGYREVLLDTLRSMTSARALYEKYGFGLVPAYYQSHPDAVFYRLGL